MAASDVTLRMLLTGEDRSASRALRGVGNEAGKTGGKMSKFAGLGKAAMFGVAGALLAVGASAIKFGGDSLKAFADAEKSQAKLDDAWKRFPKTADVNIAKLREYNQALQRKTGADADDIAAGQATLAMFNLTGKQIQKTTPLLVDYATKTGKDMPTAAKTMGKALLGNTRALKDMGIDYKSTGDKGKDYANIMALLEGKIGGYATSIPEAELKSKQLATSFGDLQEKVGEKLQPALIALTDAGLGMLDWLEQNPELVEGVSTAFEALGNMMRWFWNNVLLPVVKFWITSNAEVVKGLGMILEATGRMTGNKDLEDFGKGITKAASATQDWVNSLEAIPDSVTPKVEAKGAEESKRKVTELDRRIKSLRGKIVTAKENGASESSARVKALRAKIAELKGKKVVINAEVKKTGVTYIKLAKGAGRVDLDVGYRAKGGPVTKGKPYVVGEQGWEVFVPNVSGRIMNQRQMAGPGSMGSASMTSGGNTYNSFTFNGVLTEAEAGRVYESSLNKLSRTRGRGGFGV